jgi:glutamate carboxypeptidase
MDIPDLSTALPDTLSGALPAPLFRRTVELLAGLTAISSPSGDPGGLRRMAARLGEELEARGLRVEITEEAGEDGAPLPVLLAQGKDISRGHHLLIGHLDTVLPAVPPSFAGDRLVATGAIDMKGGLAAFLGALDLLRHRGVEMPDDLLLVVVPDEEVGGVLSRAAMRTWGETARALWVLEPGEPVDREGAGAGETMVAGRRGMFNWRLEAHGQAAHSGLHYWQGRSALIAAAGWCCEIEAHSDRAGGPTVNVGRLVAGDTSFVENLAGHASLLGTDHQVNVVPDRAIAEGEVRFLRREEGERMAETLAVLARNIGRDTGTRLSLSVTGTVPPVDPGGPHAGLADRAVALAADRGWRLEIERERGGISFPNFLPDPSRLPILDGLGPVGGGMHTREEHVSLPSLARRIVLLADLLALPLETA